MADGNIEDDNNSVILPKLYGVKMFLESVAQSTMDGVHAIQQKIEYAAKQHKVISDFKHSEEIYDRIDKLKWMSKQTKTLNSMNMDWARREKEYMRLEAVYAARYGRLGKTFEPAQMEELFSIWSDGYLELAETRSKFVKDSDAGYILPVAQFLHTNIKQAKQKKRECNLASLEKENNVRALLRKTENENRKPIDKRDDFGLRLLEEKVQSSEQKYELVSGEMMMLIDSLELKQRHQLPREFLALIEAQEAYYSESLAVLRKMKELILPFAEEMESADFVPRYRIHEKRDNRNESDPESDSFEEDLDVSSENEDTAPPPLPKKTTAAATAAATTTASSTSTTSSNSGANSFAPRIPPKDVKNDVVSSSEDSDDVVDKKYNISGNGNGNNNNDNGNKSKDLLDSDDSDSDDELDDELDPR